MRTETIRPAAAARRYGVSTRTLSRWARSGLIGTARIGGIRMYVADDIADLIAANTTRRTVMPLTLPAVADDSWRSDPVWAGVVTR